MADRKARGDASAQPIVLCIQVRKAKFGRQSPRRLWRLADLLRPKAIDSPACSRHHQPTHGGDGGQQNRPDRVRGR